MAKCQAILIDLLESQHAQVDKENSELFHNKRVRNIAKHCAETLQNISILMLYTSSNPIEAQYYSAKLSSFHQCAIDAVHLKRRWFTMKVSLSCNISSILLDPFAFHVLAKANSHIRLHLNNMAKHRRVT